MTAPISRLGEIAPALAAILKKKVSAPQDGSAITRMIDELYRSSRDGLETASETEFAPLWLLYAVTSELLRYSIEDDAIEIQNFAEELTQAFARYQEDGDLSSLSVLLNLLYRVAHSEPIPTDDYLVWLPQATIVTSIRRALGATAIPVSSEFYVDLPILENSLSDPRLASGIIGAYEERLRALIASEGIDHLCFIEKSAGPLGALPLLAALVDRLRIPAFTFRENYWLKRTHLVGTLPNESSRVAVVYDLLVSGNGIRHAASQLKQAHGINISAAVVLYQYAQANSDEATNAGIRVEALVNRADLVDVQYEQREYQERIHGIVGEDDLETRSARAPRVDTSGPSAPTQETGMPKPSKTSPDETLAPSPHLFPGQDTKKAVASALSFLKTSSASEFRDLVRSALDRDKSKTG